MSVNSFDRVFRELTKSPTSGMRVWIGGTERKLKGMAVFTTKNYSGEYYKLFFEDESFLMLVPGDEEIYFSPRIVEHIAEIDDKVIGTEKLFYVGKQFVLKDPDNYQFVKARMVGGPGDVEGEVRFSDYVPIDGSKEILSPGFLSFTGKRADIYCVLISPEKISVSV